MPKLTATKAPQVGNLKGCTTWCDRCQSYTDHNGPWHQEKGAGGGG
jgi:hypothetical protein